MKIKYKNTRFTDYHTLIFYVFFATFYSAYLQMLWDKNDIQRIKHILFSLKLGQTIETHKFLAIIPKF